MDGLDILAHLDEHAALLARHWPTFSEAELRRYPGPGRWSKKEILGHLVDSAANNHARFVLVQTAPAPLQLVAYDQETWVRLAHYQHLPSAQLLGLWTAYNQLLRHLLRHIPGALLAIKCHTPHGNLVTLEWLIRDYVLHLDHHVQQIVHDHG